MANLAPAPTAPPDLEDVKQRLLRRDAGAICGWYSWVHGKVTSVSFAQAPFLTMFMCR